MKSCALAARAAAIMSASLASGRPSRRLSATLPSNSVASCATTAIISRTGIERTHVVAADADRAALRIVLAQQQAHDGRLARTARPDDRHRLAFAYREAQRRMRVRAAPRIREADGVERDLRPQARDARRIGGRCMTLRVEQRVDRIRRRLADHPLVQHGTQRSGRKISLPAISTISSASGSCRRAARATRRPRSRRPRRGRCRDR